MTDEPNDLPLQRQIFSLESKIDKVDGKIDTLTAVLGEQWKGLESRFTMSSNQTEQGMRIATTNIERLLLDQSAIHTEVDSLKSENRHMRKESERLAENLRWVTRTVVASLLSGLIAVIIYFGTH